LFVQIIDLGFFEKPRENASEFGTINKLEVVEVYLFSRNV